MRPHRMEGRAPEQTLGSLLLKALIPAMGALPIQPAHPPKALPPDAITLSDRISTYVFWENINI